MRNLTVAEAVQLIQSEYGEQVTKSSLMAWMRSGRCPFGEYIRKQGKQKGQFLLFRHRIDAYFRPKHELGRAVIDGIYINGSNCHQIS